ncbi:MAG: amino acid permease [Kiritimatiellae bacterium]|nr:amino acid permease [Kiritimatiellia bacterium]
MNSVCNGGGNAAKTKLGPYLAPIAVVALSFGYAVGWGSFVMPGTMFLPGAGPAGTAIGILVGSLAMAVFAFNYHRMLQCVTGPGGAYAFTTEVFGADHGFLLAWFLWLTYVAILWANATALVLLVRYLFGDALQFGFHYTMAGFEVYFGEVMVCVAATALCGAVCLFRKRLAAWLNTILAGAFVAGVAAVFVAALSHHEGGFAAMGPAFSPEGGHFMQVIHILAMIPWAFVGFEAIVHSSAEFRFPVRRTFGILLAAIALSASVYLLLALLPVVSLPDGYANWREYIEDLPNLRGIDAMPVFAASKRALGAAGKSVIGGAMLAAQLTGIFGTLIASSRLMHAMSNGGAIPGWFGRLNREGAPANAVLFVTCVSFAIPFLGRTVTGWPVDVSNLGAALAYGYTSAASFAVAKKETGRAARVGEALGIAGVVMAIGFALLMLVPNYISGETLSAESYLVLAIWCLAGFLQYRHVFLVDWLSRFGRTIVVWISILVLIFFSSLMWIRLAICDASEAAFGALVGETVDSHMVEGILRHVGTDMLVKMCVELLLLVSSLAIVINLFNVLRRRENRLLQQKIEAEESAGKSRSYFFSTMSHDIRTPLNAIIGYSEMMKMGFKTDAEREQAVDSILVSGKALLRLVDHVLDFSKLESGSLEIIPVHTAASKLIGDLVESFRAANANPALEIRSRAEGLPALMVDPQRIGQLLLNLVSNAVKFTKSGHVEVRARFDSSDGASGTLRIEVEDTGCGIGKEDMELIMSPYEKVSAKEARHGGTGIGLALCRQLVKAMGGEIAVASTLGKGSTFTVAIPDVKVSVEMTSEGEGAAQAPQASLVPVPCASRAAQAPQAPVPASRRILIVDDQKMNLMVLKAMLKKLGDFDVVTAENGRRALDALEGPDAQPFDMVLTDMWMPEMDGEGLVKAIRASERLKSLPVYVVTADVEMQKRYEEVGFTGILLKPVTVATIGPILEGCEGRR